MNERACSPLSLLRTARCWFGTVLMEALAIPTQMNHRLATWPGKSTATCAASVECNGGLL